MTEADAQFKELRADIREGFKTLNDRVDGLVTRNELKAELRRIDEKHEQYASDTRQQFEIRDTKLSEFANSVRWAVGIGITAATLVLGLLGLVINTFIN